MKYTIRWADDERSNAKIINAGNEEEARTLFMKGQEARDEEIIIEKEGGEVVATYPSPIAIAKEKRKHRGANNQKSKTVAASLTSSTDQKLDEIRSLLTQILWAIWGVGAMFAVTFIVPQFLN